MERGEEKEAHEQGRQLAQPTEEALDQNWSETVEDLVADGDTEAAISLLETVVSKLETQAPSLQLASALTELAKLYSSNDFSLKSDQLLSRSTLIRERCSLHPGPSGDEEDADGGLKGEGDSVRDGSFADDWESLADRAPNELLSTQHLPPVANISLKDAKVETSNTRGKDQFSDTSCTDDKKDLYKSKQQSEELKLDWEDIADGSPGALLSLPCLPSPSNVTLEGRKDQTPIRRGRGQFSYKGHDLYTDRPSDRCIADDAEDEDSCRSIQQNIESKHSKYGTRHVLVLADFPPSTRTMELEKLFERFKDRSVAIRWVNDTTALAVFRTPSVAQEACDLVQCPFTVRILDEDDHLLGSISTRDLEPPRQRPQTSARTAQRLIAHAIGMKMPATNFGSRELKTQEEARKNRIVTRQKMRDDAWGDE